MWVSFLFYFLNKISSSSSYTSSTMFIKWVLQYWFFIVSTVIVVYFMIFSLNLLVLLILLSSFSFTNSFILQCYCYKNWPSYFSKFFLISLSIFFLIYFITYLLYLPFLFCKYLWHIPFDNLIRQNRSRFSLRRLSMFLIDILRHNYNLLHIQCHKSLWDFLPFCIDLRHFSFFSSFTFFMLFA